MGYTHYFTQKRTVTEAEWTKICNAFRSAVQLAKVPLINGYYESIRLPAISAHVIAFNGIGDDGHEDLRLSRELQPETAWQKEHNFGAFAFCKTARKPYDVLVVALLCIVEKHAKGAFDIGSDGDSSEWHDGAMLAENAMVKAVRIPKGVRKAPQTA